MTRWLRFTSTAGAASALAAAHAAPLQPSSGALTLDGTLDGSGRIEIRAVLKEGSFSGQARLMLEGQLIEAPLKEGRSYLENGRCYFRFEQDRARGDIAGRCDSTSLDGRFETFIPGIGGRSGPVRARLALQGSGTEVGSGPAAGRVPDAKLVCAYQDRRFSAKPGEATQYSLAYSNMTSLYLAGSRYTAGPASGSFERLGADKIRLTSGPWAGAIGTLEADRSGRPAVVFHIEENRRADGVHRIDPYTTRCTQPGA